MEGRPLGVTLGFIFYPWGARALSASLHHALLSWWLLLGLEQWSWPPMDRDYILILKLNKKEDRRANLIQTDSFSTLFLSNLLVTATKKWTRTISHMCIALFLPLNIFYLDFHIWYLEAEVTRSPIIWPKFIPVKW